jgi:hypothetical protein
MRVPVFRRVCDTFYRVCLAMGLLFAVSSWAYGDNDGINKLVHEECHHGPALNDYGAARLCGDYQYLIGDLGGRIYPTVFIYCRLTLMID